MGCFRITAAVLAAATCLFGQTLDFTSTIGGWEFGGDGTGPGTTGAIVHETTLGHTAAGSLALQSPGDSLNKVTRSVYFDKGWPGPVSVGVWARTLNPLPENGEAACNVHLFFRVGPNAVPTWSGLLIPTGQIGGDSEQSRGDIRIVPWQSVATL